jgi:hypothetical protein
MKLVIDEEKNTAIWHRGPELAVDNGPSEQVEQWLKKNDYQRWLARLRKCRI